MAWLLGRLGGDFGAFFSVHHAFGVGTREPRRFPPWRFFPHGGCGDRDGAYDQEGYRTKGWRLGRFGEDAVVGFWCGAKYFLADSLAFFGCVFFSDSLGPASYR